MKQKVIKTSDEAARLAPERVRIWRDAFALAPWDRDHTDAPLVYFSPCYDCDKAATDAPTVEDDDGNETPAPGVLIAQVFAYEHGGVVVRTKQTTPAGCACGCVWCYAHKFREYYGDGVQFEDVARDFVEEVNAYYNGDVYGVTVEEWDDAARDWAWVDGQGETYPGRTDADTLAALIGPGLQPGRVVCADTDAAQFVGLEYDDGAPQIVAA